MEHIIVRHGSGAYAPSRFGGHELIWQEPVSTVRTHTGARILITGTRSEIVTTHGTSSISNDVPRSIAGDHEGIVAFWTATAQAWATSAARDAAELEDEARGEFVIDGHAVTAPGFTSLEQLEAFVSRAKAAQLRTWPARPGAVLVSSTRETGGRYAVTRSSCECRGHQSHGRCLHRALALWLVDVEGVPVSRVTTIGVNEAGVTMRPGPIPATEAA